MKGNNVYYPFGSLMPKRNFTSEDYRFGFNGMERDDDIKGDGIDPESGGGNSYDFGARIYDPRVGRWWSPDPKENEYRSWSTYNYTFNNPIIITDPTGKGGEAVIEDGKLVIYQHFMVYGNSQLLNNEETPIKIQEHYNKALNEHPTKMKGPDNKIYDVSFNITVEVVSEQTAIDAAQNNVRQNFDAKLNFMRIEDGGDLRQNSMTNNLRAADGSRTNSPKGGDNSMVLSSEYLFTTRMTHEMFVHPLIGRNVKSHIFKWNGEAASESGEELSIRAVVSTIGIPARYKTNKGKLDITLRDVLPTDKSKIAFGPLSQNKAMAGGATNTIFRADGSSFYFDQTGTIVEGANRNPEVKQDGGANDDTQNPEDAPDFVGPKQN